MILLPDNVVSDLSAATAREWLVTNGLGGFAAGTVSGVATRRYHGLLVAALAPPRARHVVLSHLDETLLVRGRTIELSAHAFPDVVAPEGWRRVAGFALDPLPVWTLRAGALTLERSVFMVRGANTTVLRYTLRESPAGVLLTLRPFGAFRDFHQHRKHDAGMKLDAVVDPEDPRTVRWTPYPDWVTLTMRAPGVFVSSPAWWHNFVHAVEHERGLDDREDLATPGEWHLALAPGDTAYVAFSVDASVPYDLAEAEREARERLVALAPPEVRDPRESALHRAVDAYRVEKSDPPALLAGYPWFEDWGRDTLIAFTGAYLVTGRYDEGRRLLAAFARYIDQGMLPNRFPDGGGGGADYNTVDAPVWFFHAARRYVQYSGDRDFAVEVLRPALREIEGCFRKGTRYNIHVGDDGLVYAGGPGTQLTWMDARIGDTVFTPRHGAPVEVNALWHAGMLTLAWFAELAGDAVDAEAHRAEARRTREGFRARFWNDYTAYPYDVVRAHDRDASVRPNALYAVALPGELLDATQRAAVLDRARRELLIPLALRTLSPSDPQYRGRYEGDPWSRDGAYHQGTAWPFLLGAYTTALVRHARYAGDPAALAKARAEVRGLFEGLADALGAQCVGHLAELFEGDPPHRPVGCFAQAWSDCEVLRALHEDAYGRGPEDLP